MKALHALSLAVALVATSAAHAKYDFQKAAGTKYVLELYNPLKMLFKEKNPAQQLDVVFAQQPLATAFRALLAERKAEESYDFLFAVLQQTEGRALFDTYINEKAQKSVSISGAARKLIVDGLAADKANKKRTDKKRWNELLAPAIADVKKLLRESEQFRDYLTAAKAAYESLGKVVAKGQWYNKVRVLPGDILLYVDRGWATKVSVAQGAQRLIVPMTNFGTYKGSIYTHHAAVVVDRGNEGLGIAQSVSDAGVSMKAEDVDTETGFKANPTTYGSYMVFRLKDGAAKGAVKALNEVAINWTSDGKKALGYAGLGDLLMPAFKSSAYWLMAAAEAKLYHAASKTGGVAQKFFCSQLVIALYQAALGGDTAATRKLMALHARYTSPMKLHHYLATNDNWVLVGTETY